MDSGLKLNKMEEKVKIWHKYRTFWISDPKVCLKQQE